MDQAGLLAGRGAIPGHSIRTSGIELGPPVHTRTCASQEPLLPCRPATSALSLLIDLITSGHLRHTHSWTPSHDVPGHPPPSFPWPWLEFRSNRPRRRPHSPATAQQSRWIDATAKELLCRNELTTNMIPSSTDPPFCSSLVPTERQHHPWLPFLMHGERSAVALAVRAPRPSPVKRIPIELNRRRGGPTIRDPRSGTLADPLLQTQGSANFSSVEIVSTM